MAQNYKVFVEGRPLIYSQGKETIPNEIEEFFPSCATRHYERLAQVLRDTNYPLEWFSQNPKETIQQFFQQFNFIPAAGGIVLREENGHHSYLFIERLGHLDLPKGKMEKNETPLEAAQREIEEECGIHGIQFIEALPNSFHTYFLYNQHVLKETHWFLFRYEGNEILLPQIEEGITAVKWLSKKEVLEQLDRTYPSLVDVIRAVLR
jgi:8-oxo-dGTP pyrophosphatase MutT (NUDIX family)